MYGTVQGRGLQLGRGFGFIKGDSGESYFLHTNSIVDPYLPFDETIVGRRVEFDVDRSEKGLAAVNVREANVREQG